MWLYRMPKGNDFALFYYYAYFGPLALLLEQAGELTEQKEKLPIVKSLPFLAQW